MANVLEQAGDIAGIFGVPGSGLLSGVGGLFGGSRDRLCESGVQKSAIEAALRRTDSSTRARIQELTRLVFGDSRDIGGKLDEDFLCRTDSSFVNRPGVSELRTLLVEILDPDAAEPFAEGAYLDDVAAAPLPSPTSPGGGSFYTAIPRYDVGGNLVPAGTPGATTTAPSSSAPPAGMLALAGLLLVVLLVWATR